MQSVYDLDKKLLSLAEKAEEEVKQKFKEYDNLCLYNSARVLKAFQKQKVANTDFAEVNGYGSWDEGRNKLEAIYADLFDTEDAVDGIVSGMAGDERDEDSRGQSQPYKYNRKYREVVV